MRNEKERVQTRVIREKLIVKKIYMKIDEEG